MKLLEGIDPCHAEDYERQLYGPCSLNTAVFDKKLQEPGH